MVRTGTQKWRAQLPVLVFLALLGCQPSSPSPFSVSFSPTPPTTAAARVLISVDTAYVVTGLDITGRGLEDPTLSVFSLSASQTSPGRFVVETVSFPGEGIWRLTIRGDGPSGEVVDSVDVHVVGG